MPAQSTGRSRSGLLRTVVGAVRSALRPGTPGLGERGRAVPRMVHAVLRGRYRGVTPGHLGLLALAVLYVVSPVDLVPEVVLGPLGLADDAVVVTWLVASLVHDTEAFLAWERGADGGDGPTDATGRPQDAAHDAGSGPAGSRRSQTVPGRVVP